MRTKAGARIKGLVASSKALEEEVARLRDVEEINAANGSKIETLKSALDVVQVGPEPAPAT